MRKVAEDPEIEQRFGGNGEQEWERRLGSEVEKIRRLGQGWVLMFWATFAEAEE